MTWHQWHQTALMPKRMGLSSSCAFLNDSWFHCSHETLVSVNRKASLTLQQNYINIASGWLNSLQQICRFSVAGAGADFLKKGYFQQ